MFSGLSAFPITPADEAGAVDDGALVKLLRRLADAGVDSIGLLGSTGSYPYLSRDQRRRAIEVARETLGDARTLIVGIGAFSTREVVDLAGDAERSGANGLLLAPVSYQPLTDNEVFEHFRAVANETTLPICVYNNPATTHFNISPDLLGRLATIERVIAAKNPAPATGEAAGVHRAHAERVPEQFSLGYSVDWNAVEAQIGGGQAWYSVAAGLFPEPCVAISEALAASSHEAARALDAKMAPLWALFREYSSFRVVYAAANHLGLTSAQPPRPVLPLPAAARARVAEVVEQMRPLLGTT